MIHAAGLTKSFGQRRVLDGLDFDVAAGEVLLLLGDNGAGKSTLLRCLLGILPCEGIVEVAGFDPRRQGRAVRSRVGYMPQRDGLHGDMRVLETLRFYGSLHGVERDRQAEVLVRARLEDAADARVDELSGGMRQRLAFALAMLSDPPVLLLDEPTASLDGWSREYLVESVLTLAARGKAIVLSTHSEYPMLRRTGRCAWLRGGRLFDAPAAPTTPMTSEVEA